MKNNRKYIPLNIQKFSDEIEAGTTIQINGSATLTDVDTTKESRVLRLLGQTSQNGTPTPSSPIPVNVVSGDNEINICGKNLFNPSETWNNWYGTTCTINNQQITWSGTSTTGISRKAADVNLPSGTYTITLQTISGNHTNGKHIWIDYMQGNTKIASDNFTQDGSKQKTLSDRVDNIKMGFDNADTFNNYTFVIQIEKGSTATTYEPYIGNTYPLYLGVENLVDSNINIERTLASYGNVNAIINTACTLKAGTYTLSFDMKSDSDTGRHLNKINLFNASTLIKAINYYKIATTQYERQSIELILDSEITFNIFAIQVAEAGTYYFKDFQIEAGSKANSYSEYGTTPIELCKIGTYQDYIYKDNGSWYLHKEIGKVVLDGTESGWSYQSNNKRFYRYFSDLKNNGEVNASDTYCNYFTPSDTLNIPYTIVHWSNALFFYSGDMFSSLSEVTTWLGTTKPIVYYVLATPTNTEITDTNLIEQLESLSS